MLSSAIKLTDLNDYILPAQDCVVYISEEKTDKNINIRKPDLIKVRDKIKNDSENNIDKDNNSAAQVSLYDCLACSGCVTTSEVLLFKDQSIEKFFDRVKNSVFTVVSFSVESIDFISSYYGIKPRECFKKLAYILKNYLKVFLVLDTCATDSFLLVEILREFLERKQSANKKNESLKLFTSHCPGWICFAEKTLSSEKIKTLSNLKTSQQILGHLIKTCSVDAYNILYYWKKYAHPLSIIKQLVKKYYLLNSINKLTENDIYHVTVMPCYDKKLEIHRIENIVINVPEVDTVLTTVEIFELLDKLGINNLKNENINYSLNDDIFLGTANTNIWDKTLQEELPDSILKFLNNKEVKNNNNINHEKNCLCCHTPRFSKWNNSSGCFLEYVFRRSVKILFNNSIPKNQKLKMRLIANKSIQETTFEVDNEIKLRFFKAYGFRSIQNIVNSDINADFIEIMACPGGCKRGAGNKSLNKTELIKVENDDIILEPHEHPLIEFIYKYNYNKSDKYFQWTKANYKALNSEKKNQNFIGMNELKW